MLRLGPYQKAWSEQYASAPDMSLREYLTVLGRIARDADIGVLLSVDELHYADRDDAKRLANDLQHVTKRKRLPVAFIGAGLLELQYTLMEDKKNSFFKRANQYTMTPLSYPDAVQGIRAPVEHAGGSIEGNALVRAAESVDGSPYKMQLIGHAAWQMSNSPHQTIDMLSATEAIRHADALFQKNVTEPAFYDLSDTEQRYLETLVLLGEHGSTSRLAAVMDMDTREVRRTARRLDLSGYIERHGRNSPTITDLVPRDYIIQECELNDEDTWESVGVVPTEISADSSTSQRHAVGCNQWMPRSQTRCVLKRGHSGRCRSTK